MRGGGWGGGLAPPTEKLDMFQDCESEATLTATDCRAAVCCDARVMIVWRLGLKGKASVSSEAGKGLEGGGF
jgi:hypothetical protein